MTYQTTPTDPPMPENSVDDPNQVMWMDDNTNMPTYTITLTNNTLHTVYPFLFATNDAAECFTKDDDGQYVCSNYDPNNPAKNPGCIYDPIDPYNKDYRGYIGYTGEDGKNCLGLPSGQTVIIKVPLAFWDAGRIFIAGNSANLTPNATFAQSDPPINPYQYYQKNQNNGDTARYQQVMDQPLSPSKSPAVVLWYRAEVAAVPLNDAPAQLLEFTIRDQWQYSLNSQLDKNTLGPLINYDVSYVDTIYLPVAMEATYIDGDPNKAFGWIGASQTEEEFQDAFKAFISSGSGNGLGAYFGTDSNGNSRGYTQYNSTDPNAGIKLPSGAQAIGDSPFQDKRSSYNQNTYLLSSGGTGGIEADINTSPDQNGSTTLKITFNSGPSGNEQKATLSAAPPGLMDVTCSDQTPHCPGLMQNETKLLSSSVDGDGLTGSVTLSKATNPVPTGTSCTVQFRRPISDYLTSTILDLWYSWAKYYIDHHPIRSQQKYSGTLTSDRKLTFAKPVLANTLVPGMKVTGNGIPANSDGSFCTIAALSLDGNQQIQSVMLSELVKSNSSDTYTFDPLEPIAGFDNPLVQPFPLTFSEEADTAMAFSQAVYQAMSAMSTIPPDPKDKNPPPLPIWVVYNVIGCNVGQIPNIGQPNDNRIGSEITNKIKSVLRGVPDFTDPNWPESKWYPDPSTATGGCKFNAYNLDPFVWFVHKQLGLSGYGFSVDDDVADVGANNATNLAIAITGLNGLPNQHEWSPESPYGS